MGAESGRTGARPAMVGVIHYPMISRKVLRFRTRSVFCAQMDALLTHVWKPRESSARDIAAYVLLCCVSCVVCLFGVRYIQLTVLPATPLDEAHIVRVV